MCVHGGELHHLKLQIQTVLRIERNNFLLYQGHNILQQGQGNEN